MNLKEWLKLEGKNINQTYFLEKLIGVGGFGAVFRASEVVQNQHMRSLAIKVIDIDHADDGDRVGLAELQAAVNFDHPHLIRCFTCGAWENDIGEFLYLVMELADTSLGKQLKQDNTLPEPTIRTLAQHTAEALVYLHEQGFVHRDLKPDNILRVKDRWKLSDFGILRKMSDRSVTVTKNQKLTDGYAPPEAYDGEISTGWDIWSLGIVISQAFSGGLPYEFKTERELIKRIILCDLQIPTLPMPFDDLVKQCLQEETRQRLTAVKVLEVLNPSSNPLVLDLGNGVKLELVEIPAGSFMMGSDDDGNEKPIRKVTLKAFRMGKYPITQKQYKAVMENNPSHFQGDENCPVENVSWNDAIEFCKKLSGMTGQTVKLPSEAQWEYACRSGSSGKYCFGDDVNQLERYAWYNENSDSKTHAVGKKLANAWGLHDMHGNIWEWCEDIWHENYNDAPTDGSAWLNDGEQNRRSLRGGSRYNFNIFCRSTVRNWVIADKRYYKFGFRVVV